MKTRTTLINLFTSLSNNTSTTNATLAGQLISDQHRYLIQRYFDNERTITTTTVGGGALTLTGALLTGATSATLSAVWAYPTCRQLVNFSNTNQRSVLFTYNSTAITWEGGLTSGATSAITTVGVQDYTIPANVSKIKNDTITIGQLKFTPKEIKTRNEWDMVNMLPYTSDIPQYYFIYNGKLSLFPIPATTGNVITFNYKTRVSDLSFDDYPATGTQTLDTGGMVAGSTSVIGKAPGTWAGFPQNTDVTSFNLFIKADPLTGGDGIWYPIYRFNSNTTLTLASPVVNAPAITSSTTYTIGQMPLLSEDFHDMLVYGALMTYYSAIVPDKGKYSQFADMYKQRLVLLEDYAGTKSVNVDLGTEPQVVNPNLFLYAN